MGGNKKRKLTMHSSPKAGDPGFKTATQLRNARKRRRLKNEKKATAKATREGKKSFDHFTNEKTPRNNVDPSLQYIDDPTKAPVVQRAIAFFRDHPAVPLCNADNGVSSSKPSSFDIVVGPTSGWRTVSKQAVRMSSGCLCIGLFVPGSHDLLEIPNCEAHHPRINSAVKILQKKCRQLEIPPYSEKTGEGNLRHVIIHVERATGRQQITLVWNRDDGSSGGIAGEASSNLLENLCKSLIQISEKKDNPFFELHSLWIHFNNNSKFNNNIIDYKGRWEQKFGKVDAIVEHLKVGADQYLFVPLQFPPQVFRQANIDAFSGIISKIRSWITRRKRTAHLNQCLELYGGVGTIGLHLVDLIGDSFVSSDENPFNKACFEKAVKRLQVTKPRRQCKSIQYKAKNATDLVLEDSVIFAGAQMVIVDPPRKGLEKEVVHALCDRHRGANLHTLIYISCGFDAFCRDFEQLTVHGEWRLDHAEGHLLFPGSDAIETLAFFTRSTST